MAERRMFAKSIVLSDAFLDMPLSARCLYFTLGMLADDDGFVGNPKSIMRQCGASQDDMNVLLGKRFLLGFESGVIVIKHWRMNNYLQNDRHKATTYIEELSTLKIDNKGAYTEVAKIERLEPMYTECIQNVYEMDTQYSIGKDSKDKDSKGKDSIDKYNIPPLSPTGETEKPSYDFNHHSNVVNYQHIKDSYSESAEYPYDKECVYYIKIHVELDECVTSWMRYKDEKKPKSSNHYSETGMTTLLRKIYTTSVNCGANSVIDCIELSMSNNYQGIVWEKMQNKDGSKGSTDLASKWLNA